MSLYRIIRSDVTTSSPDLNLKQNQIPDSPMSPARRTSRGSQRMRPSRYAPSPLEFDGEHTGKGLYINTILKCRQIMTEGRNVLFR
jgi:hypothetical protein